MANLNAYKKNKRIDLGHFLSMLKFLTQLSLSFNVNLTGEGGVQITHLCGTYGYLPISINMTFLYDKKITSFPYRLQKKLLKQHAKMAAEPYQFRYECKLCGAKALIKVPTTTNSTGPAGSTNHFSSASSGRRSLIRALSFHNIYSATITLFFFIRYPLVRGKQMFSPTNR